MVHQMAAAAGNDRWSSRYHKADREIRTNPRRRFPSDATDGGVPLGIELSGSRGDPNRHGARPGMTIGPPAIVWNASQAGSAAGNDTFHRLW